MRYAPRPMFQRSFTWPRMPMYSLTRPLILDTSWATGISLPENGALIDFLPKPTPPPFFDLTLLSPAIELSRSPMDDRLRPLPLEVVGDLVLRGRGVGLEREVVVSNLLAVTLDGGEHVVSHVLDRLGDVVEESLL